MSVAELQNLEGRASLARDAQDERAAADAQARWARLAALVALVAFVTVLGRGAVAGYQALTDGFVAPVTLSPDSEAVLQDKLSLGRLLSERDGAAARIVEDTAAVEALRASMALLQRLEASASRSLGWAREQLTTEEWRGASDRELLVAQQRELEAAAARQRQFVAELEKNLAAGLVHRADVERERSRRDQAEVALLQNRREQAVALAQARRTAATGRALRSGSGRLLSSPEMQAQLELTTRIRIDLLRAQSDVSGRLARLGADREQVARLDQLVAQVQEKPTLKAVAGNQHLAFAPYGELKGARAGAAVFRCPLWGLFGCSRVGSVARLLPGEVASQDTWGMAARGQYLLLELAEPSAAQARSLRIRAPGDGASGPDALASSR